MACSLLFCPDFRSRTRNRHVDKLRQRNIHKGDHVKNVLSHFDLMLWFGVFHHEKKTCALLE